MNNDLEEMLREEKEYCTKKLNEIKRADDFPAKYLTDHSEYWEGRIEEINIILDFINN